MKFKLVVMNLDKFFKPEESSWPVVLLEVFMPHLVDWPTKIRLDKIYEIQDFIMKVESDLKANEFNVNKCNKSVENDVKDEESQFCELEDSNQQFDNMHNVDSSSYDNEYKEEEQCDSSNGLPSSIECECVTMPVVEVSSKEEDVCDDQNVAFSQCITNKSTIVNVPSHLNNNHSQGEETRDEVLLSVDEIFDLLAHDFERYANLYKDAYALPRFAILYGEVISPKFDVEEDVVLEYALSSLGGVCDGNLYINTLDNFYVENENVGIRFVSDSWFSCFHEDEIHLDSSYEKNINSNELVYPSELFEENFDMDHQHIVRRNFHDDSYELRSNHLLEYEENGVSVQFDLWCTNVPSEEKSDFSYSSYPKAKGELQSDSCNSLNEVEYKHFVFLVEGIHDSVTSDQF